MFFIKKSVKYVNEFSFLFIAKYYLKYFCVRSVKLNSFVFILNKLILNWNLELFCKYAITGCIVLIEINQFKSKFHLAVFFIY